MRNSNAEKNAPRPALALRVLSSGSTLHGVRECAALARPALGDIDVATDHGHNIRAAIMQGTAEADVVLIPTEMMAELQSTRLVRDPVALGTVGIGGVIRAGSPMPNIAAMQDLRNAIVTADAVLLTRAPTGDHLRNVIATLGLAETVAPKLLRFDTSRALNIHLAGRSDNALGFGPETEIRAGKDVAWIGDVPAEIQIALPYTAAVLANSRTPDTAGAFLSFLTTAAARKIFHRSGIR